MALPRNVQKQQSVAEKLQQDLNQPVPRPGDDPPADPAIVDPPPADPPNAAAIPPKAGEEPPKDPDTDWEKRYKGTKKLYDTEIPKLRKIAEDATAEASALRTQVSDLQTRLEAFESKPASAPTPNLDLTEEEREQIGENWIEVMGKVANNSTVELANQLIKMEKEIAALKSGQEQLQETIQVNNQEDFYRELGRIVQTETGKDWRQINQDVDFHVYLAEEVGDSGHERNDFLLEAHKNLNVVQAAKFFVNFVKSLDKGVSPPPADPVQTDDLKVPPELIQPDAKSGGKPPVAEVKYYTYDDIDKFYRDEREGKFKGREAEAREIEKDILAAGQQGRILQPRKHAPA